MSAGQAVTTAAVTHREAKTHAALVAAYRAGSGLVAVAAIRSVTGLRIATLDVEHGDRRSDTGEMIDGLWWSVRDGHARRISSLANARLRRRQSRDDVISVLAATVKQLGVPLYSDEEIGREAASVIARVDALIEDFKRDGKLRSVNQSYRTQRVEAAARGQKVPPFADWFTNYKARLAHDVAQTLRQV